MRNIKLVVPSIIIGTAIFVGGCANQTTGTSKCPSDLTGYKEGIATAQQVKACMGTPSDEDHNPDGRYVYGYILKDNTVVKFLFDSKNTLIRVRGYKVDIPQ